MPTQQIQIIDFCKPGFGIKKKVSLQSPLDVVQPLGIASLGCQPVVSTQRTAGGVVLARVKHDTGADTQDLLTVVDDQDPTEWPYYSAYIAAFQGINPITGTISSPFPATAVNYSFDWYVDSFIAYRDSTPNNPDFTFTESPVGFGSFSSAPKLILGGLEIYDASDLGFRRAYHTYQQQMLFGYCPSGPMSIIYDSTVPELKWHDTAFGHVFTFSLQDPPPPAVHYTTYTASIQLWEVYPALTSFSGTTVVPAIISPLSTENAQPPDYTRTYAYIDYGQVTMLGYGDDMGTTNYTITPVRPWMVVYADSTTDSITFNSTSGTSFGGTSPAARLPNSSPPDNMFTGTQSFSWSGPLTTTSFTFEIVVGGKTLTPTVQTFGDSSIPRFYEGLCRTSIVTV